MAHPTSLRTLLALFLVSGALGLGYQVLWSKIVLHVVGVSSWSHAIVLAAFMAGLALGGRFLGSLADRVASPLALFGWLELGVGLYAIAYPSLSTSLGGVYQRLATASPDDAHGLSGIGVKALLAGLLLLPPTILMGATYPAMMRHATKRLAEVGQRASQFYSINALGAVIGAVVMAFVCIPSLGLRGSLMVLALGNAAIGVAALVLARRDGAVNVPESAVSVPVPAEAPSPPTALGARSRILLLLLFAAGTLSFAAEIAWTRFFSMVLGSSTFSFAIIVAVFIAGISLGAGLLSRFERRLTDPLATLGWSQVLAGLLIVAPLPAMQFLPWMFGRLAQGLPPTGAAYWQFEAIKGLTCALVMFPPALLMGLCIPLAVKVSARSLGGLAADTGLVHASNTTGNVVGALAAGLLLLPWLGVETLLRTAACLLAIVGLGALALSAGSDWRRLARRALPAVALLLLLAMLLPAWNPAWFTLVPFRRAPMPAFAGARDIVASRDVLLFKDDPAANVTVIEQDGPEGLVRSLLINGKPDASSSGDMPTQILLAHLPLLAHGAPRSVLVVGLASGVTSGAILRHDVERLDIVDIVQAMPEASRLFDRWSGAPLDDPRTRVIVDDARAYISGTRSRYDVIISEPSNPWIAGTGSLFSLEHYERARQAMAPRGIYCQWLQSYELSDATLTAIVATFREAFPHVIGLAVNSRDMLLLGSAQPFAFEPTRTLPLTSPAVRDQLASIGLTTPLHVSFLQCWSQATVDWLAAAAPVLNTDDNLLLEHEAPRDLFLGAEPTQVAGLDERLTAAASLPWARAMRAGGDPESSIGLMAAHRVGTARLYSASLAALADIRGGTAALQPALLSGMQDPSRFHPPSSDELLGVLRGLVMTADWPQLQRFAFAERATLAQRALLSSETARVWTSELAIQAAVGGPPADRILRPLRADLLAAAGHDLEARAQLVSLLGMSPPAGLVLAACRLDPGPACDEFLAGALRTGPNPHLERLRELRSGDSAR